MLRDLSVILCCVVAEGGEVKKNVRRYNRKLKRSNKITMRGPDGTRIPRIYKEEG